MPISRQSSSLLILATAFTLVAAPAKAFDASKIINSKTGSNQIFEFFFDFRKDGKQEEAIQVLKYAAEQGNSAAQWKLARIYQTGDGVKKDSLEAFKIFQKIAAQYPYAQPNTPSWQFSADALVALGGYYRKGIPDTLIVADENKARMMFTTAAMVFRHPGAQFELGRMQIEDRKAFGQPRVGVRNLTLAYEKGHVGAEALLGYAAFEGELVKHNPVRGLVMLGNARRRANANDLEWIKPLHDEAYALAKPEDREEAVRKLAEASTSLQ